MAGDSPCCGSVLRAMTAADKGSPLAGQKQRPSGKAFEYFVNEWASSQMSMPSPSQPIPAHRPAAAAAAAAGVAGVLYVLMLAKALYQPRWRRGGDRAAIEALFLTAGLWIVLRS